MKKNCHAVRSFNHIVEAGLLIFLVLAAVAAYLFVAVPEFRNLVRGYDCVFHHLTGLLCPSCGTTRAYIALLDMNLVMAFRYNFAMVVLLPFFIYGIFALGLVVFDQKRSLKDVRIPLWLIWSLLSLVIVYSLGRNIPALYYLWYPW